MCTSCKACPSACPHDQENGQAAGNGHVAAPRCTHGSARQPGIQAGARLPCGGPLWPRGYTPGTAHTRHPGLLQAHAGSRSACCRPAPAAGALPILFQSRFAPCLLIKWEGPPTRQRAVMAVAEHAIICVGGDQACGEGGTRKGTVQTGWSAPALAPAPQLHVARNQGPLPALRRRREAPSPRPAGCRAAGGARSGGT